VTVSKVSLDQIDQAIKDTFNYSGVFRSARISALIGVGDDMRKEIRRYISSQGDSSWPKQHPLTRGFRKSSSDEWEKKRSRKALLWLRKFARFNVDRRQGQYVIVSLGKKMEKISKEVQEGKDIPVNDKVRRLFGATRQGRNKAQVGRGFFPISKEKTKLNLPGREIFDPIIKKQRDRIPEIFEKRFIASYNRKTGKNFRFSKR